MQRKLVFLFLGLFGLSVISTADAGDIRISFKILTDANGNPPSAGNFITSDQVDVQIGHANRIFSKNKSEMRFLRDGDILVVSSSIPSEQTEIASHFADDTSVPDTYDELDSDIENNPTLYRWRDDAVNVYIFGGLGRAGARYPGYDNNRNYNAFAIYPHGGAGNPNTFIHEVGGHRIGHLPHNEDPSNFMDNDKLGEGMYDWQMDKISDFASQESNLFIHPPMYISASRGNASGSATWDDPLDTLTANILSTCALENCVIVMESGTYTGVPAIRDSTVRIRARGGRVVLKP